MNYRNHQAVAASDGDIPSRWYGKTDWFSLPRTLRYDDRLSHADARVLVAIASFDMKNGSIHPPRWQLALYTGITESNVSKRTKKLAELGWVTITARKGKVNLYQLHTPSYVMAREKTIKESVRKEIEVRTEARKRAQEQWLEKHLEGGTCESPGLDDYDEDDIQEQDE